MLSKFYLCQVSQINSITTNNHTNVILWLFRGKVRVVVFNATFNIISAISWRSVLLLEETGILGENHRPAASHW